MGYAVGTADDVNGDGWDDVIVGAPKDTDVVSREGVAYLFHGSSAGLSTAPNWSAGGGQKGAEFGASASTAGDVNGDGYAEVIVGAPLHGQPETGRVYLYHGSATGLNATADWSFGIVQADARLGVSVGTAGDVNGDGFDDVIVGAQGYSEGEAQEGAALVFYGSASGLITSTYWMTQSNQANALFGASVGTAGDVNGDSYADVIVGAPQYDKGLTDEGAAFVFYGSASGLTKHHGWIAHSDQAEAELGAAVSTAGDVNGDGYSDVVVGAPQYDGSQIDSGAIFIFSGAALGLDTTASRIVESGQTGSTFGASVSSAGDVNDDGYSDVIVGASLYENDQSDEGAAFIFYGSSTGLQRTASWQSEGNKAGTAFGYAVSTAGDVNQDGYADVVVGAPQYRIATDLCGRAFAYHGSTGGEAYIFLPLVLSLSP